MRVSMIGCGRLGLPVAVAFTEEHRVRGYDNNPELMKLRPYEQREDGINGHTFQEMFRESVEGGFLKFAPLEECVRQSEIVFVAVQTPHRPELDGTRRLTSERADFDYSFLKDAVGQVVRAAKLCTHRPVLAIISTVLPGTVRREILPLVDGIMPVVYSPFFAAMGTVVRDVLDPEFVLLGGDDAEAKGRVTSFFKLLCPDAPQVTMSIESAELTKCVYNTAISQRINMINTAMEIASKVPGCNIDSVSDALSLATRRICSPAYLRGGMPDAGACHPRDCMAMSWLAKELGLSQDLFSDVMDCRDKHVEWLAMLIGQVSKERRLPIVLLGKAFKPETSITAGSCALLLANVLTDWGVIFTHYDPLTDDGGEWWGMVVHPSVVFIATKHKVFADYKFAPGSVVLDPHRYIGPQEGVKIVRIGEGK